MVEMVNDSFAIPKLNEDGSIHLYTYEEAVKEREKMTWDTMIIPFIEALDPRE
jgi:hypothetical protein